MKRPLESNFWKFAVYLVTNKRAFMSILGVYLLTLPEATPKTIGLMLLMGNLAGFIFEIPSGYIADKMGHKNALVFARICLLISTTLFLIGSKVIFFILGAVFFNIGLAFESGTAVAFMHETIKALGRESEYSKIMGKLRSIGYAVPILFIVSLPFLVSISFKLPFAVGVVIDIIGLAVTMALVVPGKTREEIKEIQIGNFKQVLKEAHRFGFLKYAVFLAVIAGAITTSSNFKDVYQAALGIPVIYYGVFWGLSRVLVSALLVFNHKIKDMFTFHQFLLMKVVLAPALILGLGFFAAPWAIVFLFILTAAFNWSFTETKNHYLLDIIRSSHFKATLLSIEAEFTTLTIAVLSYIVGAFAAETSYAQTFQYIGIGFTIVVLVMYLVIVVRTRVQRLGRANL